LIAKNHLEELATLEKKIPRVQLPSLLITTGRGWSCRLMVRGRKPLFKYNLEKNHLS
jgi:hypothetical protein